MKGIITIQILSETKPGDDYAVESLRRHAGLIRDHIRSMPTSPVGPWDMDIQVTSVTDEAGHTLPGERTMTEIALDTVRETFARRDTV